MELISQPINTERTEATTVETSVFGEVQEGRRLDEHLSQEQARQLMHSNDSITLLMIGKACSGKSSLVNALFGKTLAKERAGPFKTTGAIGQFEDVRADAKGKSLFVYESPCIKDVVADSKVLEELKGYLHKSDLLIYCVRMDDRMNDETINALEKTISLNPYAWSSHGLIALTFANRVFSALSKSGSQSDPVREYESVVNEWRTRLREILRKKRIIDLPILPVGYHRKTRDIPKPFQLCVKKDENWLEVFWCKCLERSRETGWGALLVLSFEGVVCRLLDSMIATGLLGNAATDFITIAVSMLKDT